MLYTPKYIYNNNLDKKVCKCEECKKYRILYCHTNIVENKEELTKQMDSDAIVVCSKCGSAYRINLKHLLDKNGDKYEVNKVRHIEEKYSQVKENIIRNYNSYESISTIKSQDFFAKLIKESKEGNLDITEYVFMEK